jgi:hypothetical protein
MNESNPQTSAEISEQICALRRQAFTLLLALIVVSGTLTIFLYRQASVTRRDIENLKPQAAQLIKAFDQDRPVIQSFVQQLAAYGQTHPDFQQQVLKKYGITAQNAAAPKK